MLVVSVLEQAVTTYIAFAVTASETAFTHFGEPL